MSTSCVRCPGSATVVMAFDYDARHVWLGELVEVPRPGAGYPLCDSHAARLSPPVGWTLEDRRGAERPLFVTLEVA